MAKNIVNWFAVLVFTGVLTACGQNQGTDQGTAEKPAEAPAAPAGGDQPAAPAAPAGQ